MYICTCTHQIVVVGVEPFAQLQAALLHRVLPAAGHGQVPGEGAAGEVVEAGSGWWCWIWWLNNRMVGLFECGGGDRQMHVWTHRLGTQPRYSAQSRTQSVCIMYNTYTWVNIQ